MNLPVLELGFAKIVFQSHRNNEVICGVLRKLRSAATHRWSVDPFEIDGDLLCEVAKRIRCLSRRGEACPSRTKKNAISLRMGTRSLKEAVLRLRHFRARCNRPTRTAMDLLGRGTIAHILREIGADNVGPR